MKVNIDLRGAYGFGGIANFKRNIAIELLNYNDIEFVGCYNWLRKQNHNMFSWFTSKLHRSCIPDQFVYHYATKVGYKLPMTYEFMMNQKSDLNLFLTYNLPQVKFVSPVISTIHDIILLKTNLESKEVRRSHEKILFDTIHRSSHILTVSESAKKDIIDYFSLPSQKISIVHNGISHSCFTEELTTFKRRVIQCKYNLPERFILYMGAYRKHKNIENLIEAYALLPDDIRQEIKLVITCRNKILEDLVFKYKLHDDIVFCGFVDENDKCAMYKCAELVYYASFYEGFGVPIIEAQACGVPVITSLTSSMPEASGGFAEHVDPYNVDQISNSIIKLLDNVSYRNTLVNGGKLNAELYTWEQSAKEIYNIITNI